MKFDFGGWIGQVTTGHGAMILGPTLLAASSGQITWLTATPLLIAGVVGLLWPENTALKTASQNAVTDVETLVTAYRAGLNHGGAVVVSAPVAVAAAEGGAPAPKPVAAAIAAGLALLVIAGLGLSACANQTPAQQAAAAQTVASGLICLADASGNVIATASTSDPSAVKGVNAAIAAGSTLLADPACQSALTSGAAAVTPAPVPAAVAAPAPAPAAVATPAAVP